MHTYTSGTEHNAPTIYTSAFVCMHVCMRVRTYADIRVYACMHYQDVEFKGLCRLMYIGGKSDEAFKDTVSARMRVSIHIHIQAYIYTCMYVCVYISV